MDSFSKRLKSLREQKNISVREISKITGIPISTYRSWEEGVKIVGEEPYIKLCRALNVSLYKLIIGSEELSFTKESSKDLITKMNIMKNTILDIEKVMNMPEEETPLAP